MNTSEMSIEPVPSPPAAAAPTSNSLPPPPPGPGSSPSGKLSEEDAHNAHGMAISQLVSPTSAATPKLERADPVPASTPPPPPPPASTAPVPSSTPPVSAAAASTLRQDESMELASPVQPGVMGSGIPLSDARSEKMDVDLKTPEMTSSAAGTTNGPEGDAGLSLKRSSPDDEREVERSPKRVKDEGEQGLKQEESTMQVDQQPAGSMQTSQESAQAGGSSAPPLEQSEGQAQNQTNGAPDPAHPVSDPALLPPQNLYLPGTYLPPTRPPLGSTAPMTYQQYRSLMSLLKSVKKQKDSFAFVAPVDPVALNVPHYLTIIKKPMDLGTVEQKLGQSNPAPNKSKGASGQQGQQQGPYACVADVVNDVRQVWANTRIFNGPQHVVSVSADRLEEFFENQLEKLKLNENPPPLDQAGPSSFRSQGSVPVEERTRRPSVSQPTIRRNPSDDFGAGESSRPKREIHPPTPKDSTWVEPISQVARTGKGRLNATPRMKAARMAISDLLNKGKYKMAASPFYVPVDPIALGIPNYHDVIKRPMDLSTISNKIAADQYAEVSGVDKDVKLMIKNCFTFNPPGTPVHLCGEQMQKIWGEKWKEILAVPEQDAVVEEDPALDRELEQLERQRAEISARIDEIHRIKADKGKQKAKPSAQSAWSGSKPAKAGTSGGHPHGAPSKPPNKLGRPAKNGGAGAGATGGPGPKAKKQNGRRPSDVRDYGDSDGEEMMHQAPTLAQKQELADKIADANPDVLMQALDLIQRTTQLGNHNDEIELDIDALPPNTIAQLYNLVIKGIQPGQSAPKKKKSGPKPGGQNGHQQHGQPGPKKGSKKSGMGGRGGGGAAGKNESEIERIRALEAELSRIRGDEEDDGGEDYGYDQHESGEEDYEGAYSEEEG